jgi:L-asparaginase
MNDSIHLATHVSKRDSQLMGAFGSHPGPLGHMRGGVPVLSYAPLPLPDTLSGESLGSPGMHLRAFEQHARVCIWTVSVGAVAPPTELLQKLDGLVLAGVAAGGPQGGQRHHGPGGGSLRARACHPVDGCTCTAAHRKLKRRLTPLRAVYPAAPGTGSLPASLVGLLSPTWTGRLPIVLCSRCGAGANYDDNYYRGSLAKYESKGFVLRNGYQGLSPLQAQIRLTLRLSIDMPSAVKHG